MLVALRKDGQIFSLSDKSLTKESLIKLKQMEQFYCPACRNEVIMKLGTVQAWHFSHKQNSSCTSELEGETAYHIQGKKLLYEWLLQQNSEVHLEPYLHQIKQRPDLLLITPTQKIAIEYQCARISPEVFMKRTTNYQNEGYYPLWVLGGNQLKRKNNHCFSLSSFHWLFSFFHHLQLHIISFCPSTIAFFKLSNLTPLSIQYTSVTPYFLPLASTTFDELLAIHPTTIPILQWQNQKKRYRQHRIHLSHTEKFMQQLFYQKGISLRLFPAEAGVPTPFYYKIETPAYLWQSWILEMFIMSKRAGEKLHINLVFRAFKTMAAKGFFQIRPIPLTKKISSFLSIKYFLLFLCKLNILSTEDGEMFFIRKLVERPQNIEMALKKDSIILSYSSFFNLKNYF